MDAITRVNPEHFPELVVNLDMPIRFSQTNDSWLPTHRQGDVVFTEEFIAVPAAEQAQIGTRESWRWSQHWRDLVFTHWHVPSNKLLPLIPAGLVLDTWQGTAWISAIAFHLDRVRPRGLPAFGPWSSFLELNVRTYVRRRGEPAIFFLRIHAGARLAVALARCVTPLPYAFARITYDRKGETRRFHSACRRGKKWRPLFWAEVAVSGSGPAYEEPVTDPLDAWLLERYCAYAADERGRLYRMRVQHPPWRVRRPALEASAEGLGEDWSLKLERQPDRWHVSDGTHALLWPFELVRTS